MRLSIDFVAVSAALLGLVTAQTTPRQGAIIEPAPREPLRLTTCASRISGRTLPINPFNDPAQVIEQGAIIFVPRNYILYDPQSFPFQSLTQRVQQLGLDEITGVTGEQFLSDNGVGDRYSHDMIQSATRVNDASNLARMHGLTAILHVTIFTSPNRFSPEFFDMPNSAQAPLVVITTLAQSDTPDSGVEGAGQAGFFSMMALGKATNPQTQQTEYVYKIFSPAAITPEFLTHGPVDLHRGSSPISWYTPEVFYSYPKTSPRTTFQDPIVGSGIYYTSGGELLLSCMETSALMGKNVARLIVDDMTDAGTV
ncbi:hypothetical protein N658DRAFT_525736 [Parathielavia hyrcaniae]|uniref:Prenylcysteine lyase domain-containing protein n=1 Tax=Parathielavia hyrcaniae TaxID=113614 RepID=A0AAN6PWI4_9PEZI|nr:hypothetical protein N658DRAFT_525736 [Parathielavia hyrcaniae]